MKRDRIVSTSTLSCQTQPHTPGLAGAVSYWDKLCDLMLWYQYLDGSSDNRTCTEWRMSLMMFWALPLQRVFQSCGKSVPVIFFMQSLQFFEVFCTTEQPGCQTTLWFSLSELGTHIKMMAPQKVQSLLCFLEDEVGVEWPSQGFWDVYAKSINNFNIDEDRGCDFFPLIFLKSTVVSLVLLTFRERLLPMRLDLPLPSYRPSHLWRLLAQSLLCHLQMLCCCCVWQHKHMWTDCRIGEQVNSSELCWF